MKKLIMLLILSIMLTACSSKSYLPSVVTDFSFIGPDVPSELLETEKAPDANTLKNVKISQGEKELKAYGTALVQSHYTCNQKLIALEELLK